MLEGKVCSRISPGLSLAAGRAATAGRVLGNGKADARLREIDRRESEEKRDGGHELEIDDGFEADAAHLLDVACAGYAVDEGAEDERGDDGFDEAQEDVAERRELDSSGRGCDAQGETGGHSDEDPRGEGQEGLAGGVRHSGYYRALGERRRQRHRCVKPARLV